MSFEIPIGELLASSLKCLAARSGEHERVLAEDFNGNLPRTFFRYALENRDVTAGLNLRGAVACLLRLAVGHVNTGPVSRPLCPGLPGYCSTVRLSVVAEPPFPKD